MRYWINTASRNHVKIGEDRGFVQAGHGKKAPLQCLRQGNYVVFYSPRTSLQKSKILQSFTPIARITDDFIYQVELSEIFKPHRRKADYVDCEEIEIKPLIQHLEFIKNKNSWGLKFRLKLFEITKDDFMLIASKMNAML